MLADEGLLQDIEVPLQLQVGEPADAAELVVVQDAARLEGKGMDEPAQLVILREPEYLPDLLEEIGAVDVPQDNLLLLPVVGEDDARISAVEAELMEIRQNPLDNRCREPTAACHELQQRRFPVAEEFLEREGEEREDEYPADKVPGSLDGEPAR